jgi:hypothetical protein
MRVVAGTEALTQAVMTISEETWVRRPVPVGAAEDAPGNKDQLTSLYTTIVVLRSSRSKELM